MIAFGYRYDEANQTHEFLMEVCGQVFRLADILDHAEQYDPNFVARAIEAMRMAQQKIDKIQSPTFGPD